MRTAFLLAVLACIPASAFANPRSLPFSYPYGTLGKGVGEFEQFFDLTTTPTLDSSGRREGSLRAVLTTELEYGITDRLEMGLYMQFSDFPATGDGDQGMRFDGLMQRLRYRFLEAGEAPVDVAVYAEIAQRRNEFEIEAKIILEKAVGQWRFISNLWAEYELYYNGRREWLIHPTAGSVFQATPGTHVGLEYWMNVEVGAGGPRTFNTLAHHYLGPTLLVHLGRIWWSTGAYVRMDHLGRAAELGDQFGKMWVRTMVGMEL